MATFRITDPNTGMTIRMTGDKPPSQSDIQSAFNQAKQTGSTSVTSPLSTLGSLQAIEGQTPTTPATTGNEGAITSAIGKTGVYDVPVLGGLVRGLTQPMTQAVEASLEPNIRSADMWGNILKSGNLSPSNILAQATQTANQYQPSFMSPTAYNALYNQGPASAATQLAKTVAGPASYMVPGGGFVGGVTIPGAAATGALISAAMSPKTDPVSVALESILGGGMSAAGAGVLGLGNKAMEWISSSKAPAIIKQLAQRQMGLEPAENPDVAALVEPNPISTQNNVFQESLKTNKAVQDFLKQSGKTGDINEFMSRIRDALRGVSPEARGQVGKLSDFLDQQEQWLVDSINQAIKDQSTPVSPEQAASALAGMPTGGTTMTGESVYPKFVLNRQTGKLDLVNPKVSATEGPIGEAAKWATGEPAQMTPQSTSEVPLALLNKVKSQIWGDTDAGKAMYSAAKKYIEEKLGTGNLDQIQGLWNKQHNLIVAGNNLKRIVHGVSTPSSGSSALTVTPLDVVLALVGGMAGGLPGAGTLVAAEKGLTSAMKSPEVAYAVANMMRKAPQIPNAFLQSLQSAITRGVPSAFYARQ